MPYKTSTRNIRVDAESYRRLVELSRVEDRPIVRIVRAAIAGYEARPPRPPTELYQGPLGGGPGAVRHVEPEPGCDHPRVRTLEWGTVCAVCGGVVR